MCFYNAEIKVVQNLTSPEDSPETINDVLMSTSSFQDISCYSLLVVFLDLDTSQRRSLTTEELLLFFCRRCISEFEVVSGM